MRGVRREGNTLRVIFDHTEGGLVAKGGAAQGFQIAGADGKFAWADARLEGTSVVLAAAAVPNPTQVRYAWDTDPVATLYNGAGFPAVPFRWPMPKG